MENTLRILPPFGTRSIHIRRRPSRRQSALTAKKGGRTECGFCGAKVMTSVFSAFICAAVWRQNGGYDE